MIVDDDLGILDSMSMLVRTLGYDVITCDDASLILDMVSREHPTVLLQDLKMEGLNIAGLIASLRSADETAELPIIFVSASEQIATTAARYDAFGFLSKPFTPYQLAHLLEQVLEPPAPDLRVWTQRDLMKDMGEAFHAQWSMIASLNNYLHMLRTRGASEGVREQAVRGLEETLIGLESRTDRLQLYMREFLEAVGPVLDQGAPPKDAAAGETRAPGGGSPT